MNTKKITKNCLACGICYDECPSDAIVIDNEGANIYKGYQINLDKCTDCGICSEVCSGL
jgi:formate hydrogenlyase subunit 6/NADH:ubiquinone oxidoreductase subunit I